MGSPAEAQVLKLQAAGLWTHPNNLSEVPEGALEEATNVVIDREGIVQSRRGQKQHITTDKTLYGMFETGGDLYVYSDEGTLYKVEDNGTLTGLYSWVGTSYAIDEIFGPDNKIRSTSANKNTYFTTTEGIKKLINTGIDIRALPAGGLIGINGTTATSASATGFMPNNTQIAYRCVWTYTDPNGNLILGAPSERVIVTNTSGSNANVAVTFSVPPGSTYGETYQVYRSQPSASATDVPNDEMYLVKSGQLTGGEFLAGYLAFTDTLHSEALGATLYTSVSQEGIEGANYPPPYATDIATFKSHTLYSNTKSKQYSTITLQRVGGALGMALGDTVTIDGVVYTAKAVQNLALNHFELYTSGANLSVNIEKTSQNLIRVINAATTNTTVTAYYASGYGDPPGRILLRERSYLTDLTFTGEADTWLESGIAPFGNPPKEDVYPNRIYVSKFQQPESVPLYRYLDVGSADRPIRRLITLRDSVLIFKEDGIFRLSGDTFENFSVTLVDSTSKLISDNSIVPFSNLVICYTEQGVVAVNESQIQVLSRPIERTLLELSATENRDLFEQYTFAVGYESARKYILYTISGPNSTSADQMFVYNAQTNSWTRWTGNDLKDALVGFRDDLLYQLESTATGSTITQERKTQTIQDYIDKEYVLPHPYSMTATTLYYTTGTAHPEVSWAVSQEDRTSIIKSVTRTSATSGIITTEAGFVGWNLLEPLTIYQSIDCRITTVPIHGGNPGIQKQFREGTAFFNDARFTTMDLITRNPITDVNQTQIIAPIKGGTWGLFSWGQKEWGGGLGGQQPIRFLIPTGVNRSHWIQLQMLNKEAFTSFGLSGISLIFTSMSSRIK